MVPSLDTNKDGGAIWLNDSTLRINSCSFRTNEAVAGAGGAILVKNGSRITISDSEFISNSGNDGGALAVQGSAMMLNGGRFVGNQARAGGAVIISGGISTLTATSFIDNSATSQVSSKWIMGKIITAHSCFL